MACSTSSIRLSDSISSQHHSPPDASRSAGAWPAAGWRPVRSSAVDSCSDSPTTTMGRAADSPPARSAGRALIQAMREQTLRPPRQTRARSMPAGVGQCARAAAARSAGSSRHQKSSRRMAGCGLHLPVCRPRSPGQRQHLQGALDALAIVGSMRAAATGSTLASSACSAGQPSRAARASSARARPGSPPASRQCPANRLRKYSKVPPTSSGILPLPRICSTAAQASCAESPAEYCSQGSRISISRWGCRAQHLWRRLAAADIQMPVDHGRVHADEPHRQPLRQRQGQLRLAGGRGTHQAYGNGDVAPIGHGDAHHRPRANRRSSSASDNATRVGRP